MINECIPDPAGTAVLICVLIVLFVRALVVEFDRLANIVSMAFFAGFSAMALFLVMALMRLLSEAA